MTDNHTPRPLPGAVVNIDPCTTPLGILSLRPAMLYSIGIHPWNSGVATADDCRWVRALAADPRVVAIGETGLDSVHINYGWMDCGGELMATETPPDMDAQRRLLDFHIRVSEDIRKPLLLHVVKCYPEIMRMRRRLRPTQPWVIHGFRGKPGLARELLNAGFYLSYGEYFNPSSVAATPRERMLAETDESELLINEVVRRLGVVPGVTLPARCAQSQRVSPQSR